MAVLARTLSPPDARIAGAFNLSTRPAGAFAQSAGAQVFRDRAPVQGRAEPCTH
jgi:hypothetical protein